MATKIKTNAMAWLIILAIGLGAIIFVSRFMGLTERPVATVPRIEIQTQARSFTVLSAVKDSYRVRDLNNQAELTLFVAKDAPRIKAGDVLIVRRYVMAANGLVASGLDILPPAPTVQPPKNLSKNPEIK